MPSHTGPGSSRASFPVNGPPHRRENAERRHPVRRQRAEVGEKRREAVDRKPVGGYACPSPWRLRGRRPRRGSGPGGGACAIPRGTRACRGTRAPGRGPPGGRARDRPAAATTASCGRPAPRLRATWMLDRRLRPERRGIQAGADHVYPVVPGLRRDPVSAAGRCAGRRRPGPNGGTGREPPWTGASRLRTRG